MAVGCAIARSSRVILVSDISRVFFSTLSHHPAATSAFYQSPGNVWCRRGRACRHFSSHSTPNDHSKSQKDPPHDADARSRINKEGVEVEWRRGVPHVRVPLPTSSQPCLFTLRPLANTVGDFCDMIRKEDSAIGQVAFTTKDNVRIASSNSIANLIEDDFKIKINDKEYYVKAPDRGVEINQLDRLTEIRTLVTQLYSALNAGEHTAKLEKDLQSELDILKEQLEPLEKKKQQLDVLAGRKATALTWVGLGLMSVQFGILARLTWWEYSWDIMEPVTYFVTYGTAMAAYAYFVLTKQDYILPEVRDRQHLIHVHKRASKLGLNLDEYNRLKEGVARIESDLTRLRDPLSRIPIQPFSRSLSETESPGAQISSLFSKTKSHLLSLLRRK